MGESGELTVNSRLRRSSEVHTVEIDGEAVLLHTGTNTLHRLNPSAAALWSLFDGKLTLAELSEGVALTQGVLQLEANRQLLALAAELRASGLALH